tara:strand:- start:1304 stop:2281 length:978 start_codon:yes stop_codon:yes gene_type:complete
MKERLLELIKNFGGKRILVIGDIMLDKYVWGEVSRISPEAPVQVVKAVRETYAPGGAANVANNVAALGGNVYIVGYAGEDDAKEILITEMNNIGINTDGIFIDAEKPTIQKVRVIGRNQQLLRLDYENSEKTNGEIEMGILNYISDNIDLFEGVIISDYAKGIVNEKTAGEIIKLCNENGKIIVVDPKPKHKNLYKNTTLITPNHTEALGMSGMVDKNNNDKDIEDVGHGLLSELNSSILITRGDKGMSLFEKGEVTHIPTYAREVFDIVGAGDTSVATMTLALSCGASLKEAAVLANHAAGITVGKIGTSTVSVEDLKLSVENE